MIRGICLEETEEEERQIPIQKEGCQTVYYEEYVVVLYRISIRKIERIPLRKIDGNLRHKDTEFGES